MLYIWSLSSWQGCVVHGQMTWVGRVLPLILSSHGASRHVCPSIHTTANPRSGLLHNIWLFLARAQEGGQGHSRRRDAWYPRWKCLGFQVFQSIRWILSVYRCQFQADCDWIDSSLLTCTRCWDFYDSVEQYLLANIGDQIVIHHSDCNLRHCSLMALIRWDNNDHCLLDDDLVICNKVGTHISLSVQPYPPCLPYLAYLLSQMQGMELHSWCVG